MSLAVSLIQLAPLIVSGLGVPLAVSLAVPLAVPLGVPLARSSVGGGGVSRCRRVRGQPSAARPRRRLPAQPGPIRSRPQPSAAPVKVPSWPEGARCW